MKRLIAILLLLSCFCAKANFTAQWFFQDFVQNPQAIKLIYVTPLWNVTAYGTNLIPGQRQTKQTGTNGSMTISNMIAGGYKIDFVGAWATNSFTNVFGTNVTGLVNAINYIGVSTNVDRNSVAYTQAAADGRFMTNARPTVSNYVLTATDTNGGYSWQAAAGGSPNAITNATASSSPGVSIANQVVTIGTNYDALGAAQSSTNGIGQSSGLSAFALTNQFAPSNSVFSASNSLLSDIQTTNANIRTDLSAGAIDVKLASSNALTRYVSPFGNDSTAQVGHPEKPYLTFSAAFTNCNSGDSIYLFPGSFIETNQVTFDRTVHIFGSGPDLSTLTFSNRLSSGVSGVPALIASADTYLSGLSLNFPNVSNFNWQNAPTMTNMVIRNCSITSSGSMFYLTANPTNTLNVLWSDCTMAAALDIMAPNSFGSSNLTFRAENSRFYLTNFVFNPVFINIGATITNSSFGDLTINKCQIYLANQTNGNLLSINYSTNGSLKMNDCVVSYSGTNSAFNGPDYGINLLLRQAGTNCVSVQNVLYVSNRISTRLDFPDQPHSQLYQCPVTFLSGQNTNVIVISNALTTVANGSYYIFQIAGTGRIYTNSQTLVSGLMLFQDSDNQNFDIGGGPGCVISNSASVGGSLYYKVGISPVGFWLNDVGSGLNTTGVYDYNTTNIYQQLGAIAPTFNSITNTGIYYGNGSGLTNLQASSLAGTLPLPTIPAAVVTNNNAGAVTFKGAVTTTNVPVTAYMTDGTIVNLATNGTLQLVKSGLTNNVYLTASNKTDELTWAGGTNSIMTGTNRISMAFNGTRMLIVSNDSTVSATNFNAAAAARAGYGQASAGFGFIFGDNSGIYNPAASTHTPYLANAGNAIAALDSAGFCTLSILNFGTPGLSPDGAIKRLSAGLLEVDTNLVGRGTIAFTNGIIYPPRASGPIWSTSISSNNIVEWASNAIPPAKWASYFNEASNRVDKQIYTFP